MNRALWILKLAIVFVLLPCAWATNAADGWPRRVSGKNGILTLKQAPKRIVSTSLTLTGSLLAIDAPVVASGAGMPGSRFTDSQGFFRQWGKIASQRHVQRLYIGAPNAEMVAAQAPDLIVVSARGNDSAMRIVSQLSTIAPVLVVDYDDKSWQQVVRILGKATGHEAQASAIISRFEKRVSMLKPRLNLPPQPVSAMVWNGNGREVNVWTPVSAQGQLLQQLGFQLAVTPETLASSHSLADRKDIMQLGGENLAQGLTGKSWLLLPGDNNTWQQVMQNRFLKQSEAVKQQHVYPLWNNNFRLDYYSAAETLDTLEHLFAQ